MHAGIPSAGVSISGSVPIYHTNFDTFWFYENHLDPDFRYGPALADVYGLMALRFANAQILPYDLQSYATDLQRHMETITDIAESDIFADSGLHEKVKEISNRVARYRQLSVQRSFEGKISVETLEKINRGLIQLERSFLHDEGLPFSPWLRSLYASSDPYSGYASWMLPAYRYAIEEERLDDEPFMNDLHDAHLRALDRFSERLGSVIRELE